MKHLSRWILLFAVLSLVFFILLVVFRIPFPPNPLMSYQDALDILTPLVLIPIYGVLFWSASRESPEPGWVVVFLVLAASWVEGQGMHLSANSINNLIGNLAEARVLDVTGTDIYSLTYFYDEILGHYLWHIGVLGLAVLLITREWRYPAGGATVWWSSILAGVIYGFTLFAITNEGQTVWMGLPFAILITLFGLTLGRGKLAERPVLAFFLASCLVALLLYLVWGLYWGGFPEFGEAGIL